MAPTSSVAELLNAAQDSAAACERCAGGLWKLILQDPDSSFEDLTACIDLLLTITQKSPHVDRCTKFFGLFASKAPADAEVAAAVSEELIKHLAGHLSAADKTVRYRSCQLVQQLLSGLPEGLLLDEAVLDSLTEALLERLQDKLPGIRAEAVRALCHLMDEEQESEDIAGALLSLLDGDKSKDVRVAVVQCLPLNTSTLPVLLRRTRDVSPLVRKALVLRLKGLSIKVLSICQRASVIQQLLQDRDSSVSDAAARMLAHWLEQDCGGDPLQLLQLLDVETYADAAACAVESLILSNSIHAQGQQVTGSQAGVVSYVRAAAAAAGAGGSAAGLCSLRRLCGQQGRLLEPHEALLWRCLCEWLQTDAISRGLAAAATGGARAAVQAAVAAERHEALEEVLPEAADALMDLVLRHTAAGPSARFAAAQLLMIAAKCTEWTDVASRGSAAPFLQQLISLDPVKEAEGSGEAAAAAAGRAATGRTSSSHSRGGGVSSDGEADDVLGLQLAGNGGDGMFEAAVVQLVRSLHGSVEGFRAAMLDGISGLAAAAGLLRKPADVACSSGDGDGAVESGQQQQQHQAAFTVGAADSSQVLQLLRYVWLMLQQLPLRQQRPTESTLSCISFDSLWELLLLLALKQEHVHSRAKAVECIGLYAVVSAAHKPSLLTSAVALLGPLLAAEGSVMVRAAAARALADIALLFGPAAVDAVLLRPAAAAGHEAAADGQTAIDANHSNSSSSGGAGGSSVHGRGLLELLMLQAEGLLAEAEDAAASASNKAKGRTASRSTARTKPALEDCSVLSASAAELMAVVAEALAKLLLHQRAWLRQYPRYIAPNTEASPPAAETAPASRPVQLPPDSQQQQSRLLQRALALLLQLQFHPATATVTQLCQCLSVFFDVFSAASEGNRLQLATACLPAAHQALNVTTKKHPAPLLVKYVLQLLQQARLRREQADTPSASAQGVETPLCETYGSVARLMLGEVTLVAPITVGAGHQPAKFKPYLSALLKVVCELPLNYSQPNNSSSSSLPCLPELQSLVNNLSVTISDATLGKDITALQQHLQALADAAGQAQQQQLSGDALEELVQQVCRLSLQQLPPLPGALADAAAAAAAAAGGGGGSSSSSSTAAAGTATTAAVRRGRSRSRTAVGGGSGTTAAGGRGRPSAAATRRAAAAASDDSSSSSSSSSGAEGDSDADDSSSSSDDGAEPAAVPAGAAARLGRGSAAAAADAGGRSRARRAAAAAAPPGGHESPYDTEADSSDHDDKDSVDVDSARCAAAPRITAAAAARDPAADSGDSEGGYSSGMDSGCGAEGTPTTHTRAAAATAAVKPGLSGAKSGRAAAGGPAGSRRQPLAPSSIDNRRQ